MNDLKYIKKYYGENFAHLCRELFPTILENKGLLPIILTTKFAPNKSLYNDILNEGLIDEFKSFIYSFATNSDKKITLPENKTPQELLDGAGYILYPECKTEQDIAQFKKYYEKDEMLCTFNGDRLKRCRVWFAIKKDVENIKRENFCNPQRQDEYGTSVISIQFSKTKPCILSIKNRYNHKVSNPDATFGNNLDNIIPGLTDAFAREYDLDLIDGITRKFNIENYILASDGRFYKSNVERNNIHYCCNNYVIKDGVAEQLDKNRFVLIDEYVIDKKEKKVMLFDSGLKCKQDAFIESLGEIYDIIIISKKNDCLIKILSNTGETKIVSSENAILEYENNSIKSIGDGFLSYNKNLKNFEAQNLENVGLDFLFYNKALKNINLPNIKNLGECFLSQNEHLINLNMPKLEKVGNYFLQHNIFLEKLNLPNIKKIGSMFLCNNVILNEFTAPKLEEVGQDFLKINENLKLLNLPNLKKVGDDFLSSNKILEGFIAPNIKTTGENFLLRTIYIDKSVFNESNCSMIK